MKTHKIFIALIVIIIIGLVFLVSLLFINKREVTVGVACTMEALQCPDGSYVGRSGPKCEFAKCPILTEGSIGIGETQNIDGVRITLNKIVQDSRCPVDVVCIRAGNTTFNITMQSESVNETKDIVSDAEPLLFDLYKISILKVAPEARSNVQMSARDYTVTFKVIAN